MKILGLLLLAALVRSELPILCGDDVCHRYASCVGGSCECNDGYTGDGKNCVGTNICGTSADDCHSDATCTNTGPGTYRCTCNEGFKGDGKSCTASEGDVEGLCQKMDIIFVLDRSSSIRRSDYDLMREFLLSLGKKLRIGERNSKGEVVGQGAVVTFSEAGTTRITLQQSQTPGSFEQVVRRMPGPLSGGRTKTHRGLAVADQQVAVKRAGYREDDPDVTRIFMVITDGQQTRESPRRGYLYVRDAMQPFFRRDMNVFAVGVGLTQSAAVQQIRDMVENPENAILAKDFQELTATVNSFINKFCPVPSLCGSADDCAPEATCEDTGPGEYQCTCPNGEVGNGKFCLIPPACGSPKDDCHPSFATCTNTSPGQFECKCIAGYSGDGRTCIVDKVCGTPKDDCHEHATCTDLEPGKYECKCNLGYSGDGKTCIAIGIAFDSLTYDVREEDKKAIVKLSVESGEITTPLTLNFNTQFGTAGEADFTAVSRSVTLQPGQSGPLLVEIDVTDDTQVESTESFQVSLSDPSYAVEIGQPATVNIIDNDEALIAFSKRIVDVREDQTAAMEIGFTSGSASSPVTVSLATNAGSASDEDFVGKTVDVRFEAGETGPKTVEFKIVDDSMVENTESFTVSMVSSSLSAVKVGEPSTVNILDNDEATIGFTEDVYETAENAGKARVGVRFLSGGADVPVTVGFQTTQGTAGEDDFISKTMDVTFEPGEQETKYIEIEITDDDLLEPTESFGVSLVSSSVEAVKLGKPSSVNILDNDDAVIGFISKSYDVPEDQKAKVQIGFLQGEATSPVTVRLATASATASDEDFVEKEVEVTFQPGETGPKEVEIDLFDDSLVEATESFNVRLVSTTNPAIQLGDPSSVNILDNDDAMISFESSVYDVNEDGKAVVEIGFSSGQSAVPVTVQLATSPATASGEDFVSKTVNVTFEPGEMGPKQVEFEIVDDKLVENTESFKVSVVSSSVPAITSGEPATVNIRDNDEAIIAFTTSVYNIPENKNAFVEFGFVSGQAAVPVTVSLSTAPNTAVAGDFVSKNVNVTFAPGETGPKQVEIEIVDDTLVEPTEDFKVSMTSSYPGVKTGKASEVKILDNDEAIISFVEGSYDVKEDENAVIEVAVSSGNITIPVTVRLTTEPLTAGDKDFVPQTVDITFSPGDLSPKFLEIPIIDDDLVEPTEEFKVNLVSSSVPSVKLGEPTSIRIHLQDNDDAVIGFTKGAYDVIENEDVEVKIGFASGTTSTPVTVTLQTVSVTASESIDYVPKKVNVTFQPGETGTKTVKIDVIDDDLVEATEEFQVAVVSTSVPAVTWGEPVSVNILDNDEAFIQFDQESYDVNEDEDAVVQVEFTRGEVTSPVTIQLAAKTGTAKNEDFIAKTVNVTFQPGEKGPKSVKFDIVDDPLVEAKENFYVSFASSTSSAVTFGEPTVIGIRDNDEAVIGFSRSVYEVTEDENAMVDVEITDGKIDIPVTVRVSAAPLTASAQDFVPKEFDVTFAPGETGPKSIEIGVLDDDSLENAEAFQVSLISSSVPAVKLGQPSSVNIVDNDEVLVNFTKLEYEGNENEKATVQVQLASGQSDIPVTVWLRKSPVTAGSSDFDGEPQTITFQPGETGPKSIDIDLVDDQLLEDTERFTVFLTSPNPTVKTGKPATVRILDNEVAPICGTPQDDCHRYATCTDTGPGKYSCKCNEGYTGDGKTCRAILICGTDQDDCHDDATCVDSGPGSYICTCDEGFTGDGKTCEAQPRPEPKCKKMDLIMVLDRSSSIRPDDYEHMRDFLLSIGKTLRIGERDENGDIIGQGAIVTFSEKGTLRITLAESREPGKFAEVVRTMPGPLPGGRTKTHRGLALADKQVVTVDAGLRMNDANVEKIFMVITDGRQTVESRRRGYKYVGDAMKPFNDRGYLDVFAVGVGLDDEKAINEVKDMVRLPENAILPKNYKQLTETVESFIKMFCPVPSICGTERDDCDKNLAKCADTGSGLYECTCNDGYVGNGKKCIVPYVCGTVRDDCHPYRASCTDTGNGNYNCTCVKNYFGDGKSCEAAKICGTERDDCHEHATCTDTGPGSYKCRCNEGYVGDGKMCEVEKICGTPKDDCSEFATCRDTGPGKYECTCKPGYTGDGKLCIEIKICGTPQDDCSEFATCADTGPGSYICICNKGFTGDGKTCKEINICGTPLDDCSQFATCADTGPGAYTCTCNEGYTGDGKNCEEIKICGSPRDDCSQFATCADTGPGTYTCTCNEGYTGDGKTCEAIKICGTPQDDCSEFATCADTGPGSYTCTCNEGYTGDGKICEEIKICGTPQDDCSKFATCTDTGPGTYTCTCNDGYTGDGKTCEAIKICGTPKDDCSEYATCADTGPGIYTCTCNKGYTGDGKICEEIKICGTSQDDCSEFATCTDTGPGTYTCTCNEGYSGDGKTCKGVSVRFTKKAYISKEGDPTLPEIVISAGDISEPTTIRVTASPNTAGNDDFSPKTVDVTFQPGETGPKAVPINIIDDDAVEPNEEFTLTMSSSSPGVTVGEPATVVIEDNDKPGVSVRFTKNAYSIKEGEPALPEIVISAGDISEPTTITVTASPNTAGNDDFSPKTVDVTFQPGETGPKAVPINIIDDDAVEPNEEFTLTLSTSSPGVTVGEPATVVIKDNDKPAPCKPKTDLIFVLDRSGSIRREDYNRMREFVKKIAEELKVGETNAEGDVIGQAAIVTFSEVGEKRITLAESRDAKKFYDLVETMPGPLLGGRTKTHRGLKIADEEIAIKEAGYREDDPDVKKLLMVITDGEQTKESVRRGFVYVGDAMKPFFARNMDVFAIGVGLDNEDAIKEVKDMVEVPENAILAANFSDLLYKVESIIKKFCPETKICGTPQDDCSEFAACADTGPGSYTCTCNEGYTGDGKACEEIKVCGTPDEDCSEFATCAYTGPGTYSCTCNEGYTGDGKICEEINMCGTPQDDCSELATCADTGPGTYTCTCGEGYTGDGKTCEAISICGTDEDDCHKYAVCADTGPGQYSCTCIQGYTGDGKNCEGPEILGPILFNLTPENPSTISAAWLPPAEIIESGIIDYSVCYKDVKNGDERCTTATPTTPDGPLNMEFTNLTQDTTYEVVVRARNASGYGPPSNVMTVKTPVLDIEPCNKKTDTIFVVDRSAKINEDGYNMIRSFIQSVAKRLRIGVKNEKKEIIGQGAIVTFSDIGQKIITLKGSRTPGKFAKAVQSMPGPLSDGTTKTHRGLEVAYRQVALVEEGLRAYDDSVHKVIVVITNGAQTPEQNGYVYVGNAVKPFFSRGIDVIAIGVGLKTNKAKEQLNDMVRIPENAFLVNQHSNLSSAMNNIISRVCPETKICGSPSDDCHRFATCFDTAPGEYKCVCREGYVGDGKECKEKRCKFDIGFLIDSSASMRDCNYEKEKELVKHIAEQMQVAQNKSRASVILFSTSAALYKPFNRFESLSEFEMHIDDLPMVGGTTHLDKAIELAASDMFTTKNGMRDNLVPKLLFVLTDGAQADGSLSKPLQEIVSSLHNRNIRVIVVGAGEADEQQLSALVQSSADLLMVKRFEDATDQINTFSENMCLVGRCSHMKQSVPVRIDGCVSPRPIKIGMCMGKCVTGPNFRMQDGVFKIDCQTCKPGSYSKRTVTLNCPGDRKRRFDIKEATSCVCEKCPWKKLL